MGCTNSSHAKPAEALAPPVQESTVIVEKKMEDDVSTHVSDAVATEPAAEPAANADVSVGEMTRETDPIAAKTQAAEGVTDTTKIVLDDSDVVQVEEEEFEVTKRSAGCGCCAQQTDADCSLLRGCFSCNVESNAGLTYCRC